MSVSTQKYTQLLKDFLDYSQQNIDHAALEEIKFKFQKQINSRRSYEAIVDIKTLLKVLEKRGILQYNNIEVLQDIVLLYIKSEYAKKLISDYHQWLRENSKINNFYDSGKCKNSLDDIQSNFSNSLIQISKTEHPSDNLENTSNHDSLEQNKDNLLPVESSTNISALLTNSNISKKKKKSFLKKIKKKEYFILSLVTLIFLFILISLIWILVYIFSQSTAVVPKTELVTTEQNQSEMAFYTTTTNLRFSTNSRFSMNHTQYSGPTQVPIPTTNHEEQLKRLVISKVSKEVGKHWADVARLLDLQESEIDRIEIKYLKDQNYKEMFIEAMELYFSEPHQNWKIELTRALEYSRRRDLKEMVEQLPNFIS